LPLQSLRPVVCVLHEVCGQASALGGCGLMRRRLALAGRSGRRLRHYLCASSAVKAARSRSCRPHTQTRPGCARLLAAAQEYHRLAGGFAAHPAPYCATGSLPEPRPKARRSPPPPRARDLERFSPQPGQPEQRSQDSMSRTRAYSRRAVVTRWKPSKSTSRSHRSQRSSDTEQQVGSDTAQCP